MSATRNSSRRTHARGITLIELMVALVLGLIVSGAALTLFVSNRQTYTASESLGRIQESERTAFELMSRDVREAAGNACEKGLNVANVLNGPTSAWYTDWAGGVRGYDGATAFADAPFGTAKEDRVAGTDAIELKSSVSNGVTVTDHQPTSAQFKVNTVDHGLNDGDIAMVCDFNHAAIFQITNAQPGTNVTVVHQTGNTVNPGNCSKGLGYPTDCGSVNGNTYAYGPNSIIAKLRATRWYIGYNGRTYNGQPSRSLYQSTLQNTGGVLSVVDNEITEGVRDMQLRYLLTGASDYVDAATVPAGDWLTDKVIAVDIELTLQGQDRVSTDGTVLERKLNHIVTIRNRAP